MARLPCKYYLKESCTTPFCDKWHPPECLFNKSESGCWFGEKCSYAHCQVDEQPSKRYQKNGDTSAVAMLKKDESYDRTMKLVVCRDTSHERHGPVVCNSSNTRQLGFVLQESRAAEVLIDFAEELTHTETNQMCKIQKNRRTLRWHSRPKSIDWNDLPSWTSSAQTQNLRIGFRKRRNGKSEVPVSSVEAGQKYHQKKGEIQSSILLSLGNRRLPACAIKS